MYIAYLDDSGSTGHNLEDRQSPFQVVTAVIVQDFYFNALEYRHAQSIESLVPEDDRENFEFHASELFWGQGAFKSLGVERSRDAFSKVIGTLGIWGGLPIIYGAVDKSKLLRSPMASAMPIDVAFRLCAEGIEEWMYSHAVADLAILIADDTKNVVDKGNIKRAFRQLRRRLRIVDYRAYFPDGYSGSVPEGGDTGTLRHVLDDIYFGDSRDSVGIQLADLCGFLIHRHLSGKEDSSCLYGKISQHIVFSRILPE